MKITITRALSELKLLEKRIFDAINSGVFVIGNKKSADKVMKTYTKEEFNKTVKADFQSIMDLIERRKKIKSAIVQSNANSIVEIAEKQYTVAGAIERKNSIIYEKELLEELERQYKRAVATVNMENERVQSQLDKLLEVLAGKEAKNIVAESNEMAKSYLNDNEFEIVDPLNIEKVIDELKKDIDEFEHEVDFVLSEHNSLTTIEIED